MSRKVVVEVTTKLVIVVDEGVEIKELIGEMNYDFGFEPGENRATIEDTEIIDYEITDSR